MSGTLAVCKIPEDVKGTLKKFRFGKGKSPSTTALILKINREKMELEVEESLEECTVDEIRSELPVQQPRFIVLSYEVKYNDGRLNYPLCLVFHSPAGCSPEIQMLYAGSKNNLINECQLTKNAEIREIDDLTKEFLDTKFA